MKAIFTKAQSTNSTQTHKKRAEVSIQPLNESEMKGKKKGESEQLQKLHSCVIGEINK